jgi:hypothetical protein
MNGVKEALEANFCRQNWHQLKMLNIITLFPQILRSLVPSFCEFYFPDARKAHLQQNDKIESKILKQQFEKLATTEWFLEQTNFDQMLFGVDRNLYCLR